MKGKTRQAHEINNQRNHAYRQLHRRRAELAAVIGPGERARLEAEHQQWAMNIENLTRQHNRYTTRAASYAIGGDPTTNTLRQAINNRTRQLIRDTLTNPPDWLRNTQADTVNELLEQISNTVIATEHGTDITMRTTPHAATTIRRNTTRR